LKWEGIRLALDKSWLVLCIIREADNALTFQTILNRSNLQAKELEEAMGVLSLGGKIRTFAGDEVKPLLERRFFSVHENRSEIDDLIAGQLPLLAGEACLYFAYGSDLDPQLYRSSPGVHFLMKGRLKGYHLTFADNLTGCAGGGMANLCRSSDGEIWGAVYYLESMKRIFSGGELKIRIPVEGVVGAMCVESSVFKTHSTLFPSRHYLEKMIAGGQFFGFPQKYLRQVSAMPTID